MVFTISSKFPQNWGQVHSSPRNPFWPKCLLSSEKHSFHEALCSSWEPFPAPCSWQGLPPGASWQRTPCAGASASLLPASCSRAAWQPARQQQSGNPMLFPECNPNTTLCTEVGRNIFELTGSGIRPCILQTSIFSRWKGFCLSLFVSCVPLGSVKQPTEREQGDLQTHVLQQCWSPKLVAVSSGQPQPEYHTKSWDKLP